MSDHSFLSTHKCPDSGNGPLRSRLGDLQYHNRKRQFPDVEAVVAGKIDQRCWIVGYESAQQIVHDLLALPE